jgi:hypothetical protein
MQCRCLVVAVSLALSACAALDPRPSRYAPVDAVIGETVQAARAPAPEQKVALARAEQLFAGEASPVNRLRLATLLATLPDPLRDDARAGELLDPLTDANDAGVGRFAALLSTQIAERRRMARDAERSARERERVDKERERVDKERDKREEALRQQLEALRAIERGIMQREERLRRRQN